MNSVIQFLNKSLLLSICLHLIGVTIAAVSIVGTTEVGHEDAFVAEFITLPKETIRPRHVDRKPRTDLKQRLQVPHIQRVEQVIQVPRLRVDTAPVFTGIATEPLAGYGSFVSYHSGRSENYPAAPTITSVSSPPARFTPKRTARPTFTTSAIAASPEVAEFPLDPARLMAPIQNARFSNKVEPRYPETARAAHIQGTVLLEATIGVDGKARDIQVLEVVGVNGLGCVAAAVQALKASQFVPATQAEFAISQRIRIPYRFSLKGDK